MFGFIFAKQRVASVLGLVVALGAAGSVLAGGDAGFKARGEFGRGWSLGSGAPQRVARSYRSTDANWSRISVAESQLASVDSTSAATIVPVAESVKPSAMSNGHLSDNNATVTPAPTSTQQCDHAKVGGICCHNVF